MSLVKNTFEAINDMKHSNIPILDIQLWTFAYKRLLNRPYENEVTLKEHD